LVTSRLKNAYNGLDVDWIDTGNYFNFLWKGYSAKSLCFCCQKCENEGSASAGWQWMGQATTTQWMGQATTQ
jgi:hypothetical protein